MAGYGTPDWYDPTSSGGTLIDGRAPVITTTFTSPAFYVGIYDTVVFNITNGDVNVNYYALVKYYRDAALTQLINQQSIMWVASQSLIYPSVVQGPYMSYTITASGGLAVGAQAISIYAAKGFPRGVDLASQTAPLSSFSTAFAANSYTTLPKWTWYYGKVQVSLFSGSGGPCYANLAFFNSQTSTWTQFMTIGVNMFTSALPVLVTLPPAPVRFEIGNQATAQSIAGNVTVAFP
jgi:hypothetical protein